MTTLEDFSTRLHHQVVGQRWIGLKQPASQIQTFPITIITHAEEKHMPLSHKLFIAQWIHENTR